MTCALCEGHRVETEVLYLVEPILHLTAEVRDGSIVCPRGPSDSNVLADRESGYVETVRCHCLFLKRIYFESTSCQSKAANI